ncbi:MAG TPA: DUF418 domain-containing protein [Chryseosolibacter sp.]|nr:DUF418 domain-containing protein [Chryseosolibacter sp.]
MTPSPTLQKRIESIDVLRGFALFGIALVHMVEQYYAGQPPQAVMEATPSTVGDQIAQGFVGLLIMGKFYMIFSFLFGLSFFIQLSKDNEQRKFLLKFSWRLLILFAIGMIHHLHYRGDILTIYAMLGFGLLVFYRLPDRWLLIISLLLVFNIPALATRAVQLFLSVESNPFDVEQDVLMAYYQAVKSGTYLEIIKANFEAFAYKMSFQVWSGRLYITLGLFLLGLYVGRKRFFENIAGHRLLLRKCIRYSLVTIGVSILISLVIFGGSQAAGIGIPAPVGMLIGGFFYDLFNAALGLIYLCGILLLFEKEKWKALLLVLFPVGRMGLTTYLMQALFGTLIFFSYGLGLLNELGALYCLFLGLLLFVLQILFAHYWFRYFAFGPVEWLWRSLTHFRVERIAHPTRSHLPVS